MNKSITLTAVATLIISSVGFVALADDQHGNGGYGGRGMHHNFDFSEIDANGDGQITAEEIEAMRAARFANMDANGDGEISAEEFVAAHQDNLEERANYMIEEFDADGSGGLSEDEMPKPGDSDKMADHMIERFDTDGDGQISEAEFEEKMSQKDGYGGKKNK